MRIDVFWQIIFHNQQISKMHIRYNNSVDIVADVMSFSLAVPSGSHLSYLLGSCHTQVVALQLIKKIKR